MAVLLKGELKIQFTRIVFDMGQTQSVHSGGKYPAFFPNTQKGYIKIAP
jgi:hypothetical protein